MNNKNTKAACCGCTDRIKHREDQELKKLINRLNRIEGQIRGIKKMVEDDRYCIDIITQVSATNAALNAFNKELLSQHIQSCVVEDVKSGNIEKIDELCATLQKIMK